ncbi:tetratricopeptide repeat protein, partial [Acinetobacter baumannii]
IQIASLGPDHPDTATTEDALGRLYLKDGKLVEAREHLDKALAIRKKILSPQHPDIGFSLKSESKLAMKEGHKKEAIALLHDSLDVFRA